MNPDDLAFLELFDARDSQSRIVQESFPRLAEWAASLGWDNLVKVPLKPEAGMAVGNCFNNVAGKVKRDGGAVEYGRMFLLIPEQAIQTTSHAVWISPTGERIDITQPEGGHVQEHVLFAPDPSVGERRQGSRSYHCLLSTNPKVRSIFSLEQALEDWMADAFESLDDLATLDFALLDKIIEECELPKELKTCIVENVLPPVFFLLRSEQLGRKKGN